MSTSVPTDSNWQPALGGDGIVTGLADIDQCVRIILNSPKGCDPHRPDFACDIHKYVDWPQNRAAAYIVRDARTAILKYEPRIKDVAFSIAHVVGGIEITVDWLPIAGLGITWQRTVVSLPGASA